MPLVRRFSLLIPLLLPLGCTPVNEDPFDRGGDPDDDDDGGHDGPTADERVAWFDLVRTARFGAGSVGVSTSVSFFAPAELDPPAPEGLDVCLVGSAPIDPWAIPASGTGYGVPVVNLDGEDWEIEMIGTPYFTRDLPERTWIPGTEVALFAPGGASADATTWLSALVVPETLVGSEALLTEDGIELTWTAGNEQDALRLTVKSVGSTEVDYVVCLPADDGSFLLKAEDLVDYPAGDVVVTLQRERARDDWEFGPGAFGASLGASRLQAEFSIPDDFFEDAGDDDDSN